MFATQSNFQDPLAGKGFILGFLEQLLYHIDQWAYSDKALIDTVNIAKDQATRIWCRGSQHRPLKSIVIILRVGTVYTGYEYFRSIYLDRSIDYIQGCAQLYPW